MTPTLVGAPLQIHPRRQVRRLRSRLPSSARAGRQDVGGGGHAGSAGLPRARGQAAPPHLSAGPGRRRPPSPAWGAAATMRRDVKLQLPLRWTEAPSVAVAAAPLTRVAAPPAADGHHRRPGARPPCHNARSSAGPRRTASGRQHRAWGAATPCCHSAGRFRPLSPGLGRRHAVARGQAPAPAAPAGSPCAAAVAPQCRLACCIVGERDGGRGRRGGRGRKEESRAW
ncbi:unnamed protein product [Urochloa humidicola]